MPGLPLWLAGTAVAILVFTVTGAFGTSDLAGWRRLAFWTALLSLNSCLWLAWFAATVQQPSGWWRQALLGAPLLNLPVPIEVIGLLRLVGASPPADWPRIWVHAAALSGGLLLLLIVALQRRPAPGVLLPSKGKLWRAGVPSAEVAALSAEDHYCRLWRKDGSNMLLHGRFADLVQELADQDGTVVRRGQWVAAAGVAAVQRNGRRWHILLQDGRSLPVSDTAVSDLRTRGWISPRRGASGSRPIR